MLYAHKRYIGKIEEVTEDNVVLHSIYGTYYPLKGDWIFTDLTGNKRIIPKGQLEEYYEPVNLAYADVEFTEEEIAKAYAEGLPNNVEDEDYINSFKKIMTTV